MHHSPLTAGLELIPLFAPLAINNTSRQAGGAIGIAVAGAVAGQPTPTHAFIAGFHSVAIASALLYAAAAAIVPVSLSR